MPDTVLLSREDYGTNNRRERHSVLVGVSQWILINPAQSGIAVRPGAGGSMTVETTQSPPSIVLADNAIGTSNAIAVAWPNGSVTAAADALVRLATAVRFTATSQPGVAEISEVRG